VLQEPFNACGCTHHLPAYDRRRGIDATVVYRWLHPTCPVKAEQGGLRAITYQP